MGLGPAPSLSAFELGYRDAVVSFEFAALDYAAPERNSFAYKLEGFDRDWIDLGHQGRVTFTNLDAGQYTLKVRAANADGAWNEEGLALPLHVTPPPWKSPGPMPCIFWPRSPPSSWWSAPQQAQGRPRGGVPKASGAGGAAADAGTRRAQFGTGAGQHQAPETSLTDALTGLRNRRFLFERAAQGGLGPFSADHAELRRGTLHEAHDLVFIMVDLDWFKPINDTCGHAAGDRVLMQVRTASSKRPADSPTS